MAGSMRLVRGQRDAWELRAYAGRDATGRVRHRYSTFHGSKREAERALARLVAETDRHRTTGQAATLPLWGDRTTINDVLSAWRDNGWDDLSPTTVRRYQGLWDTHVRDSIGRRPVAGLSPYDVERYFRALKAKGMAQSSVHQVRAMLHRGCRLAKKWSGGALANPIADTELPSWSLADKPQRVRAPSVEEVRRILGASCVEDVRLSTFLRVVAATGMRRGEACGLRWSDLDLGLGSVRVDESVISANGGAAVKAPKTRASVRRLALDADSRAALEVLRVEQADLASACGRSVDPDGFIFSFEPGGAAPPHPDVMSHAFTRVRQAAGVASDVHLHSLRHFHATALDPVISEAQKQARLGWSTVQMARHYTDGLATEDLRAAEHIGRLLRGDVSVVSSRPA
jgi:integrase